MFDNHAAQLSANLLAAHCKDLGLSNIERNADGTCWASIGPCDYHFGWDVVHQRIVILSQVAMPVVDQVH